MKPILFEKGKNGTYRISIQQFPKVAGLGKTEDEVSKNFLTNFNTWADTKPQVFEKWYRQNEHKIHDLNDKNLKLPVVDVPVDL